MEVTLRAEVGRDQGSRASRRLRRTGQVPAVLYGHGIDPMPIAVNHKDLAAVLKGEAGANAIISLEIEGEGTFTTLAREVVKNPVKPFINHVDFLQISLDEMVSAEVALVFVGEPVGVRLNGGVADTMRVIVNVEALPTAIPSHIDVEVSEMDINDTLTVADLVAIDGVVYTDELDTPLISVALSAAARTELGLDVVEGEEEEEEFDGEGDEDGDSEGAEEAAPDGE